MKSDEVFLRHIVDAIAKIEGYISVGQERFFAESHWHDATIRQLEIIGEAVRRLSDETRNRYPDIPWRRIAGLRDVLIHNYMGVDLKSVWQVVEVHLPGLKSAVGEMLGPSWHGSDD